MKVYRDSVNICFQDNPTKLKLDLLNLDLVIKEIKNYYKHKEN